MHNSHWHQPDSKLVTKNYSQDGNWPKLANAFEFRSCNYIQLGLGCLAKYWSLLGEGVLSSKQCI